MNSFFKSQYTYEKYCDPSSFRHHSHCVFGPIIEGVGWPHVRLSSIILFSTMKCQVRSFCRSWAETGGHLPQPTRDESGSRVNGSLGQANQNLSMGQLGPGSNIIFNCVNQNYYRVSCGPFDQSQPARLNIISAPLSGAKIPFRFKSNSIRKLMNQSEALKLN